MLGPEGKHRRKLFARHSLPESVEMNDGIALNEEIKRRRRLRVIGIFRRDSAVLQQFLDTLLKMPLRRLYFIVARRGIPYKNAVNARKILKKRCSLGIYKCNIFVGKIDIASAVYRRYLGHHLGARPLVAALAEMSLYRAAELLLHIPVK